MVSECLQPAQVTGHMGIRMEMLGGSTVYSIFLSVLCLLNIGQEPKFSEKDSLFSEPMKTLNMMNNLVSISRQSKCVKSAKKLMRLKYGYSNILKPQL